VVTLEMLIILLKELIMYTEDNTRHSYLNDRHLALIEVRNAEKRRISFMPLTRSSVHFEVASLDVSVVVYKPAVNFARKTICSNLPRLLFIF